MGIPERNCGKCCTIIDSSENRSPHVMAGINTDFFASCLDRANNRLHKVAVSFIILSPSTVGTGIGLNINPNSVVVETLESID